MKFPDGFANRRYVAKLPTNVMGFAPALPQGFANQYEIGFASMEGSWGCYRQVTR
jgi:hypothetical protein